MKMHLHRPKGIVEIDTAAVNNSDLAQYGLILSDLTQFERRDIVKEFDNLIKALKQKGIIS